MCERGVRGTWFVLGWVAERVPALVQRIAAAGHEIGSHGFRHELIGTLSPDRFRADADRSKKLLEDIVGAEVMGYRAPTFSITDWSIDVLREVGFRYDYSAFIPVISRAAWRHGLPVCVNASTRLSAPSRSPASRATRAARSRARSRIV